MMIAETFKEFARRHGDYVVCDDDCLLFESGASCDREYRSRKEPPEGNTDLLVLKKKYLTEKIKIAERTFRRLKNHCMEQASYASRYRNLPGPSPDAPQALLQLKDAIETYRAHLQAVESDLAKTREDQSRTYVEQLRREEQERQAKVVREVLKINI